MSIDKKFLLSLKIEVCCWATKHECVQKNKTRKWKKIRGKQIKEKKRKQKASLLPRTNFYLYFVSWKMSDLE